MFTRALFGGLLVGCLIYPSWADMPLAGQFESGLAGKSDTVLHRLPERPDLDATEQPGDVRFADLSALTPVPDSEAAEAAEAAESGVRQAQFKVGEGLFKVVPFGAFWGDMIYQTERTNVGAYTLWVPSAEDQGEDAFYIDVRRSRFGTHVYGPGILGVEESHALLEIDFHGEFTTENRGSVLLRHAYWEIKDEEFRFLFGQYWDVISPLWTNTLDYAVSWNAGNIGFRRRRSDTSGTTIPGKT